MQVDEAAHTSPVVTSETLESVVHFMIGELIVVGKIAHDALTVDSSSKSAKPASKGTSPKSGSGSAGEGSSAAAASGDSSDTMKWIQTETWSHRYSSEHTTATYT